MIRTNAQRSSTSDAPPSPAQTPARTSGSGSNSYAPLPPVPEHGGRITIDRRGSQTTVTTAALPPEVMFIVKRAEETAFGLMGLLAVIIIFGPFARMFARRMEKREEISAAGVNAQLLQQQLVQLQQSVDAMSVEIERVSESQRFQSKLLHEKR